jgi:flagellar basal body-associated protein FliL
MEENPNQVPAEPPDKRENAAEGAAEAAPPKKRVRWLLRVGIIAAVITGTGIGSLYLLSPGRHGPQKTKISSPLARKSGVSSMDSFVIPFREKGKYTCLTLNLSFKWADKNVEKELAPRVEEIRGIIYEALRNKLKETDEVPAVESIKEAVLSAISKVTQPSRIRDVYITRFLAL